MKGVVSVGSRESDRAAIKALRNITAISLERLGLLMFQLGNWLAIVGPLPGEAFLEGL